MNFLENYVRLEVMKKTGHRLTPGMCRSVAKVVQRPRVCQGIWELIQAKDAYWVRRYDDIDGFLKITRELHDLLDDYHLFSLFVLQKSGCPKDALFRYVFCELPEQCKLIVVSAHLIQEWTMACSYLSGGVVYRDVDRFFTGT